MDRFRYLQISQLYLKAMWLFALLLYILIPLKSGALGIVYKGIVLITFGCFLCMLALSRGQSLGSLGSWQVFMFVLLASVVFASLIVSEGNISFDTQIMGILGFLEMPIAIILMNSVAYNKKNLQYVFRINLLIAVVFSVLSVSPYAYSGKLDGLYLGYSNPNATGIYLLLNQALLLMNIGSIKKLSARLCVIGLCFYEEYLIYLTDSRTCLAVSLVIVMFYLFGKKIKIPKWLVFAALLFPLAFLFIYTGLYSSGKYNDLLILGKEFFSGREKYFLEKLSELSDHLWLGNVRNFYYTNMHNGPLTILASSGIIGYLLHFVFYSRTICKYADQADSQMKNIALIAILGVFIHSCAEAALIVGGAHYSIIIATYFWILKGDNGDYSY